MTDNERMKRESSQIATIRTELPEQKTAAVESVVEGRGGLPLAALGSKRLR